MFNLEDGRSELWQWDLNRRVIVDDKSVTEVHFCNRTDNCALVTPVFEEGGKRMAEIPNILLQSNYPIKVFAYDRYFTKQTITYKVNARSKPADYAYTETEIVTWQKIQDQINDTCAAIEAAEESRFLAERNREDAERQRRENEINRIEAEEARSDFYEQYSKDLVNTRELVDATLFSAQEALSYADAATEMAKSAAERANQAADNADEVRLSVGAVITNAENATYNAQDAAQSAYIATGNANAAAEYAYSNGNNASSAAEEASAAAQSAQRAKEEAEGATERVNVALAEMGAVYATKEGVKDVASLLYKRIENLYNGIGEELFTTDSSIAYVKDVPAEVLPYAEITKIGGMVYKDEVYGTMPIAQVTELQSTGANQLPFPYNGVRDVGSVATVGGITYTVNNDRTITVKGTPTGSAILMLAAALPVHQKKYWLAIKGDCSNVRLYLQLKDAAGEILARISTQSTTSADVSQYPSAVTATIYLNYDNETKPMSGTAEIMINMGEAALPYKPYELNTLAIPEAVRALDGYGWGIDETLYNYIDYEKKQYVKTVGRVDLGALSWKYYNSSGLTMFYAVQEDSKPAGKSLSYRYRSVTGIADFQIDTVYIGNVVKPNAINIYETEYFTAADFQAAMNGSVLYYQLANPVITDISDLIAADNFLAVEGNGAIVAINESKQCAPTAITYQLKEG